MSNYYNDNAARYFAQTVDVEMAPLRERFLALVGPGGHILDAGCGSGRDSLAFKNEGFRVTAIDASHRLAELASAHIGQAVQVLRFQEVDWTDAFEGIWACASLLHVPKSELPGVLGRLCRALKHSGAMYVSVKYGKGEHAVGNRLFTNLDESGLYELVQQAAPLEVVEVWTSPDRRSGRSNEQWLNALLRKA